MAEARESPRVRATIVIAVMAGLLGLLTAVALGFTLLFPNRIGVSFVPHSTFPQPGVSTGERTQRLSLEARQRRSLAGERGRMPIEQAMRIIAARGSHAFDPLPP